MSVGIRSKSPVERLLATHAWVVFAFLYAPIVVLAVFSFNENNNVGIWTDFSFRWYTEMFQNDAVMNALKNSMIIAVISTTVSTVLGTATAVALERFRFRGRKAFDGLVYMPVIIPDVTMAVMMLMFFTQAFDLLEVVFGLGLSKGFATIIVSHVAFNIAFVSVVVRARVAGMDATLEQAAADLYASRWQTFRYVTLPLIAPGVLGGALLAITLSLDDVVVTQFVAGPGSTTLPVYVFSLIRKGVTPTINAVSVIMLVASLILVAGSVALQRASAARGRQRLQTTGGIQ